MNDQSISPKPSTAVVVGGSVAAAAGIAGIVAAIMLAFGGSAGAHPAPAPTPSHSASVPSTPVRTAKTPTTPPAVKLSPAQVETLQRQLGQLNYYEGPVNGVMTPQTVQAITYLQRDAQLPQNGDFNQVTYLALQRMLAQGNNQMGN